MSDGIARIRANGLELAYIEAGAGPLVLLLHGFPDTAHTYEAVLPELARAGYRAVAPFQRGYVPSDLPADGDYSVLTLARDALALIEALGERSAVVVGHDWGAAAAYAAANLSPERVRKLVTIAIPHPRLVAPSLRLLWLAPHFVLFQFGRLSEWYVARNDLAYIDHLYSYWSPGWAVPKDEVERVKAGFRQPGRLAAALGYYRALLADQRDSAKLEVYRRRTEVPTLVLAGQREVALDLSIYERMPEAFTGPCETVIFPGAGHFLHREQPEAFARKLLEFLGPAR